MASNTNFICSEYWPRLYTLHLWFWNVFTFGVRHTGLFIQFFLLQFYFARSDQALNIFTATTTAGEKNKQDIGIGTCSIHWNNAFVLHKTQQRCISAYFNCFVRIRYNLTLIWKNRANWEINAANGNLMISSNIALLSRLQFRFDFFIF